MRDTAPNDTWRVTGRGWPMICFILLNAAVFCLALPALADEVLTGAAAFSDWRKDAPGVVRHIMPDALPAPYSSGSASRAPAVVSRPVGAIPRVPDGFEVALYATGLNMPRTLRAAPNGDIFVAESGAGRIRILRGADGAGRPDTVSVFADNLALPYGIAFWPPGPQPRYVYVAETGRVVRFPYQPGDLKAGGVAEVIVRQLPEGGHWTRDLAFSPDGQRLFVSVGSAGNLAAGLDGDERDRADVLIFDPDGKNKRVFASGLRNCSGLAMQPGRATLWCVVNERDGLGDDLPPDYATSVREDGFYGWPWFYIGNHPEPRLRGARAELAGIVAVPDVLIQPHSAPLGIVFYDGMQFPPAYRGDAFVALHGSWNRALRTGYKVIRLRFANGKATGEYEDFLTGFVVSDQAVWGRPVGVAMARDGALLVSEDGNGTIWRVAYHR